ncbi:MAG: roadblock/LC7 domain-containing protein [Pseudomonadota bacterium]
MNILRKSIFNFDKRKIKTTLLYAKKNNDVIDTAAVITVDGYLIESTDLMLQTAKKIASMGCSMVSLANTMTQELAMGNCRNLILENEQGIVVMIQINEQLILTTMTRDTYALGLIVGTSRLCADTIRAILNNTIRS